MTILDDWLTGTRKVDVDVLAFMHSELPAGDYDDTVLNRCDVGGPADDATDEERGSDVFDGEAGERVAVLWG